MTAFIVSWGHTLTPVEKSADLFARCPSCSALTFVVCLIGLEASRKCRYFTSFSPEKTWSWRSAKAIKQSQKLWNILTWLVFTLFSTHTQLQIWNYVYHHGGEISHSAVFVWIIFIIISRRPKQSQNCTIFTNCPVVSNMLYLSWVVYVSHEQNTLLSVCHLWHENV